MRCLSPGQELDTAHVEPKPQHPRAVRRRRRAIITAFLVVASSAALAACKPDPTPGTVMMLGDSIMFQGVGYATDPVPTNWERYYGLGWTVTTVSSIYKNPDGTPWDSPLVYLQKRVQDGAPEILIEALGTNDAGSSVDGGHWTSERRDAFSRFLNTPSPKTCIVVVPPAVGIGQPPSYAAAIGQARDDITAIAEERDAKGQPTVVESWQAVVDAHPEYLGVGGIHQVTTPIELANEAANAIVGLYRDGWTQCRQRLDQMATTTRSTTTTTTTVPDEPTTPLLDSTEPATP